MQVFFFIRNVNLCRYSKFKDYFQKKNSFHPIGILTISNRNIFSIVYFKVFETYFHFTNTPILKGGSPNAIYSKLSGKNIYYFYGFCIVNRLCSERFTFFLLFFVNPMNLTYNVLRTGMTISFNYLFIVFIEVVYKD